MDRPVTCQQCGGTMRKTKKTDISMTLQLVGVALFILGLVALFYFPLGTLIGVIVMILACRLGYSKRKVWLCKDCGYFFERA